MPGAYIVWIFFIPVYNPVQFNVLSIFDILFLRRMPYKFNEFLLFIIHVFMVKNKFSFYFLTNNQFN